MLQLLGGKTKLLSSVDWLGNVQTTDICLGLEFSNDSNDLYSVFSTSFIRRCGRDIILSMNFKILPMFHIEMH